MKLKNAVMLAPALALGFLAVTAEAQQHKATRLGNPATRFAQAAEEARRRRGCCCAATRRRPTWPRS